MIRNGFRASPADYPGPSMVDPRTIGKWVGGYKQDVSLVGARLADGPNVERFRLQEPSSEDLMIRKKMDPQISI